MLCQDPITDAATKLATSNDYTVAGVLAAVAFVAITGLVWFIRLYINQRNRDEARYQHFTETMIPIITQFKDTTVELKGLIYEWLRAQPLPGRAP